MQKREKPLKGLIFLWGRFLLAMAMLITMGYVPGQALAGRNGLPAGKILFEDKQANVKIIKTPAGVILKIITDKDGRKTIKELENYPVEPGSK